MKRTYSYAQESLGHTLGLTPVGRAVVLYAPDHYFSLLGEDATNIQKAKTLSGKYTFIHAFFFSQRELEKNLTRIVDHLSDSSTLWISWPKKESSIPSDLDEEILKALLLPFGWIDVKLCAIDQNWSGLEFVHNSQ